MYQEVFSCLGSFPGKHEPDDACFLKKTIDFFSFDTLLRCSEICDSQSFISFSHVMSCSATHFLLTVGIDIGNLLSMGSPNYNDLWRECYQKKLGLESRRDSLETELSDLRKEISHLDQILDHLAPLAGVYWGAKVSAMGITDAIRKILQDSSGRMSPTDVKNALAKEGFDLSGYTAPMASVYKVLSRLHENHEVKRDTEEGKVFYSWPEPEPPNPEPEPPIESISQSDQELDVADSVEIRDEDIPF